MVFASSSIVASVSTGHSSNPEFICFLYNCASWDTCFYWQIYTQNSTEVVEIWTRIAPSTAWMLGCSAWWHDSLKAGELDEDS